MARQEHQISIEDVQLLDAPSCEELHHICSISRDLFFEGLGKLGYEAGGIHKQVPGSEESEFVFAADNIRGFPEVGYFVSLKAKPRRQGSLIFGGLSARTAEGLPIIEIEWYPGVSAFDSAGNMLVDHIHLLSTLAHEIGHSVDENVSGEADYSKAKGRKKGHTYWHNANEMRARVFGAQVTCSVVYLLEQRFAEVPEPDADADAWLRFFANAPGGLHALRWFSEENLHAVVDMLRASLPGLTCPSPPALTPVNMYFVTGGQNFPEPKTDSEWDKVENQVDTHNASHATLLWETRLKYLRTGKGKRPDTKDWDPLGAAFYGGGRQ